MNAISKRLLSGLMVLVMVLSMVPALNLTNFAVETQASEIDYGGFNQAAAVEHNEDVMTEKAKNINDSDEAFFGTEGYLAKKTCPMCGAAEGTANWSAASTKNNNGSNGVATHYYFAAGAEVTAAGNIISSATSHTNRTVCLFIPQDATINVGANNFVYSCSPGHTVNIMGNGTVYGSSRIINTDTAASTGKTVNLYGGNYYSSGTTYAFAIRQETTLNIYEGVTIGPETSASSSNICTLGDSTAVVNMYGGTIKNGYSSQAVTGVAGGNVTLYNGGTFNMYGGTITGGRAANYGGNIMLNGGAFNMFGGTIIDGEAANGGNIALCNEQANVTMKILGGTVTSGTATNFGGNIDIYKAASSEIGGTALITNGYAKYGGNVAVENNRTLTMSGGAITGGEKATSSSGNAFYGGAVFLRESKANEGADFTMTGGLISGCSVQYAGGNISAKPGSVVTIGAGATVENGIASRTAHDSGRDGGNIHVPAGASLTVSGTVTGGEARNGKQGDGIYGAGAVTIDGVVVGEVEMVSGGSLTLKNAAVIATSYEVGGETVTGENGLVLNGVQADISNLSADADITVTAVLNDILTAPSDNAGTVAGRFTVNGDGLAVEANDDNQLVVVEGASEPIEPPVVPDHDDPNFCSDEKFFGEGGYLEKQYCPACKEFVTWNRITTRADNAHGETDHYYYADENGVVPESATYKPVQIAMIEGDSTQRVCVFIPENVTVEPTSYPFYTGGTGSVVYNVMGKGTVSAAQEVEIGGNGNTLNLYGITLTWKTPLASKRLLKAGGTSTVNIYGGTVIGPEEPETTTTYSLVTTTTTTATINMYGGTIQNGYASVGAYRGGNVTVLGTFNMYGGTITGGNTALQGGNVAVLGGTFNMYGGTIYGGTAANAGDDIFVRAANNDTGTGSMVMEGGIVVGEVVMASTGSSLTLKKAPVIATSYEVGGQTVTGDTGLYLNGVQANIDYLSADADITVTAAKDDVLTVASENIATVAECFKINTRGLLLQVVDNQLVVGSKVTVVQLRDKTEAVLGAYAADETAYLLADYKAADAENKVPYIYPINQGVWADTYINLELDGGEYRIDCYAANFVVSGTGTVSLSDSNNATDFNGNGTLRVAEGADITVAPAGFHPAYNRYFVTTQPTEEQGLWNATYVDVALTNISLRSTDAGLYYKANYKFSQKLVDTKAFAFYGVALSFDENPGSDFADKGVTHTIKSLGDDWSFINGVDKSKGLQVSGTSGSVFNILKDVNIDDDLKRSAAGNTEGLTQTIYANAYICIDRYPAAPDGSDLANAADRYYYVMADADNTSSKANAGYSLYEVVEYVNGHLADVVQTQAQLDALKAMVNKFSAEGQMENATEWATITSNILAYEIPVAAE